MEFKMNINLSRTTLLTLIGIQVVAFICLYALLNRVNKLESTHEEEGHEKEKYIFKKEKN
jgi:hypothetical protein